MSRRLLLRSTFGTLAGAAAAALGLVSAPPASARQSADLAAKIEELVRTCKLDQARVGVAVYDPVDDRVLVGFHADEPYTLASNTKLLTTSAFVCRLGVDYAFRTSFGYRGTIGGDGALDGDLWVLGGGDPALTILFDEKDPTALFRRWAQQLREKGIRRVKGVIRLDDTVFDREYVPDAWRIYDLSPWWGAPVGGLILNDSCVDLQIRPDPTPGAPVLVLPRPRTDYVRIAAEARTVADKERHGIGFFRKADTNEIAVRGDLSQKSSTLTFSVSVHDPVRYFGAVLKETLAAEGIAVDGPAEPIDTAAPPDREALVLLDTRVDPALKVMTLLNKKSHNLYAEAFLKTLGREKRGAGTREAGLAVRKEFLAELGIAENTEHTDGSGLSRGNRVSPAQMVKLLRFMRGRPEFGAWQSTLPVAGVDGTLKRRMKKDPVRGKIRAKTGHIGGVSTLSGYADAASGRTLLFSILINEVKGSASAADRFEDDFCEMLVTYKP